MQRYPTPPYLPTTQTRRDKRWATSGARLHAKTALCAGLTCGRSLCVVSLGWFGARWSEDKSRLSMVSLCGRLCACAREGGVGSQSWGCKGCEVTRGNDVVAACLTPVGAWRELSKNLCWSVILFTLLFVPFSVFCFWFGLVFTCLECNMAGKGERRREVNQNVLIVEMISPRS